MAWGRGLRDETGTTLVELLVYIVTSLVVLTAIVMFLVSSFGQENEVSSRSVASNRAEQGLEQLVRDLREAITSVSLTNPTTTSVELQFDIPTPGRDATPEQVTWLCPTAEPASYATGNCTRTLTSGGTTVTRAEIRGVQSLTLTTYAYPAADSLPATFTSLTPASTPTLAALGITLTAQVLDYGLTTASSGKIAPGASGHPIVLQTTADLRNF